MFRKFKWGGTCTKTLHSTYDIAYNEPQLSRTGMERGFRMIRIEGPPTTYPTLMPTPKTPTAAPSKKKKPSSAPTLLPTTKAKRTSFGRRNKGG